MTKAIPDGLRTLTPQLSVDGASAAIEFLKKAFGAEEVARALDPSGQKIWHAQIKIGDSVLVINDTFPEMGGNAQTGQLWVYSTDVDGMWKRAVDAGAEIKMPLQDMFWGDRTGTLADKWGNRWNLAQHTRDVSPEEMKAATEAFGKK
ncbi:MAG: VOC family protein [Kofleriaceae bacterium]